MKIAPLPENEVQRLEALRATGLLDTPPEAVFDDFTTLAAALCSTPISLISLVDQDRQWFKSRLGVEVSETPRDQAFCAHAILQEGPFVVEDTLRDERFADNPLVTGGPKIRYYAGVPLRTHDGYALGTLCVIDSAPHAVAPQTLDLLRTLARQAMAQIELRQLANELGRANHEFHRLQQEQEDFIATICHDLRSPLSTVAGLTGILEEDAELDAKQRREFLHYIAESTQQTLRLASNLIDAGRFSSGELALERRPTPLAPLLTELGRRLEMTAALEEARLELDLPPELPVLELDKGMIERAITNLVANAIRHSPPNGLVRIAVRCEAETLRIAVRDQGPGIPPEDRASLFTRYSQLSGKSHGGAGLGLYIVRQLIEAHGGSARFESPAEGGSEFVLELPLR